MTKKAAAKKTVEKVVEEPKKVEPIVKEEKKAEKEPSYKVMSMNGKLIRAYSDGSIGAALPEDYS
jgi:hypothetical protein|tara:strand:- start:1008 stop:1202 length:195 start_codon:yes stop_codon:yes gene_type:complete